MDVADAVGGFLMFEAESEEEPVALAARIPAARLGERSRCGPVKFIGKREFWLTAYPHDSNYLGCSKSSHFGLGY